MQQPMPVNVGISDLSFTVVSRRTIFKLVMMVFQVQAGVAGPIPGQNNMPGSALVQAQPIISTVRTQPQVIFLFLVEL